MVTSPSCKVNVSKSTKPVGSANYELKIGSEINTILHSLPGQGEAFLPATSEPSDTIQTYFLDIENKNVIVWYDPQKDSTYFYAEGVTNEDAKGKLLLNENSASMFYRSNYITIDTSKFNTSNVKNMGNMFGMCSRLSIIDLTNFNTEKVTNMGNMFFMCPSLHNYNFSTFNTSNVTDMSYMFFNCLFENIDLKKFDTKNVTDMSGMFSDCWYLKNLDLSNFKTGNVLYMNSMFKNCNLLENLNISSFVTSNVLSLENMFEECKQLTTLDLSSFDTSNVGSIFGMFNKCSNLTTIYVSKNFKIPERSFDQNVFLECIKLKGGAGTEYDSSKVSGLYAIIDNSTEASGYFTLKQ